MTGKAGNSFPGSRMRRMRRDEFSRRLTTGLAQWKRVQEKTKIELE